MSPWAGPRPWNTTRIIDIYIFRALTELLSQSQEFQAVPGLHLYCYVTLVAPRSETGTWPCGLAFVHQLVWKMRNVYCCLLPNIITTTATQKLIIQYVCRFRAKQSAHVILGHAVISEHFICANVKSLLANSSNPAFRNKTYIHRTSEHASSTTMIIVLDYLINLLSIKCQIKHNIIS